MNGLLDMLHAPAMRTARSLSLELLVPARANSGRANDLASSTSVMLMGLPALVARPDRTPDLAADTLKIYSSVQGVSVLLANSDGRWGTEGFR
jgi:hypothetical protein